jgi:hypothetical protein
MIITKDSMAKEREIEIKKRSDISTIYFLNGRTINNNNYNNNNVISKK